MEKNKPIKPALDAPTPEKPEFKGYTIAELRYQRALATLKREYAKEKIVNGIAKMRSRSIFGKSSSTKPGPYNSATSLVSKVLTGLNYADYAMLAFSLFGTGRKIWKFFRRK